MENGTLITHLSCIYSIRLFKDNSVYAVDMLTGKELQRDPEHNMDKVIKTAML